VDGQDGGSAPDGHGGGWLPAGHGGGCLMVSLSNAARTAALPRHGTRRRPLRCTV